MTCRESQVTLYMHTAPSLVRTFREGFPLPQILNIAEPPTSSFLENTEVQNMLIDGRWTAASAGETFDTFNPATGALLARVASGQKADVDRAVTAARRAFERDSWAHMNPHARTRMLLRLADGIDASAEELATLEALDSGIPLSVTRGMVAASSEALRYYSGWPTKLQGTVNPVDPLVHCYTVRAPVGVCAGIIPWNGPITMAVWKVAPALACGNTIILKPAEQTSLTALLLARIFIEAGLPDGVLNVVTGLGRNAGAAIAQHPGIDKVSFTGSTQTGKSVLSDSIGNLKRVTLELGGKSPHIVMADADLELAASNAAQGFCGLTGQMCIAGSRILVHQSVRDEFSELLAKKVSVYRIGDPFASDTDLGPLISAQQRDRVNSYIELGANEGARALVGGGEPFDGPGYFVKPSIFTDVDNSSRLAQEEIFGPVAAIIEFTDVDEAIRIANDTDYGLAAAVATRNVSNAHLIAQKLRAGVVWVNTYGELDPAFPFGGFKQSGIGRELGEASLDNFTELKSVMIRL
ncbi:aldehyde dehydrogenase family protein [Rhodococcus jostii]|uniref:aldehyde dehydrogenase family protein n=1 Tax=Rhodococcus jostii TaxID=132919 RepID=UPI0035EA6B1D